ncbi:MAG: alpha-1,3-glucanase, partial [Streptococcus salivarius]|nr:alpha-1,3-glucanase [Streptococcus salivarius]
TIESGWRAAGIGIFGGKGHEISGNLIKDVFAGAGIRINTVFAGHNFDLNDSGIIKIHDNTILRSGTTNDLYNLHRGAIDFQQVRGTIKNVDVYDNKLLNTLADPVITKNFEMGDNGNGEIRLSNNTIDNKATIVGAVSTVSPTKPVNNPVSETSVSETPKSEGGSSTPVSEASNSEVASETSVSETPKSEASSSTPVSEASNSEVISESSVSETAKSEASSTAPVSESPKNEETSVASSTSQVNVAITSDSPEKSPTSESTQKDPISEVSSEVIEKGSTSQVDVKVSESPTTARTSEVVSISPNSQVAYNNDLKISVTSSQLASEAIRYNSLLNEKSVDMIASKVMAVMASETLASEAASLTSSEGVAKEISSDLSELAESKKDDTPKNVARIDKATEAKQVAKSSESQASTSKEKGKSNTTTVFLLVGVAAALSISTVYLTKQGKKAGK